jgi:hypothetical protein
VGRCGADELAAMGRRARAVVTARHDPSVYEQYYFEQLTGASVEPV